MYVCVCHAVNERDVALAVAEGVHTMQQLQRRLKVATCCGQCYEAAEATLTAALTPTPEPAGMSVLAVAPA